MAPAATSPVGRAVVSNVMPAGRVCSRHEPRGSSRACNRSEPWNAALSRPSVFSLVSSAYRLIPKHFVCECQNAAYNAHIEASSFAERRERPTSRQDRLDRAWRGRMAKQGVRKALRCARGRGDPARSA